MNPLIYPRLWFGISLCLMGMMIACQAESQSNNVEGETLPTEEKAPPTLTQNKFVYWGPLFSSENGQSDWLDELEVVMQRSGWNMEFVALDPDDKIPPQDPSELLYMLIGTSYEEFATHGYNPSQAVAAMSLRIRAAQAIQARMILLAPLLPAIEIPEAEKRAYYQYYSAIADLSGQISSPILDGWNMSVAGENIWESIQNLHPDMEWRFAENLGGILTYQMEGGL